MGATARRVSATATEMLVDELRPHARNPKRPKLADPGTGRMGPGI